MASPKTPEIPVTTRTVSGIDFIYVPPGTFFMGATKKTGRHRFDPQAQKDESPVHKVTITRGFWLGRFPITNAQIRRFAEETDTEIGSLRCAGFDGSEQPATAVSRHDATAFCAWASKQTGHDITLPTEAEWEYAARGTDGRKYPWGNEAPTSERAWYGAYDSDPGAHVDKVRATAPVGERPRGAGPFLAEEQAGNVWEWCADRYGPYPNAPQRDPGLTALCLEMDTPCVLRGGSWNLSPGGLRAACRTWGLPGVRCWFFGFRLVLREAP